MKAPKVSGREICNYTPAVCNDTPAICHYTPAILHYTLVLGLLLHFLIVSELLYLVDVSGIFFCSGEGKGESEAPGGRGGQGRFFLIQNPRRGVVLPRPRRAGGTGWEGVCRDGGGGD